MSGLRNNTERDGRNINLIINEMSEQPIPVAKQDPPLVRAYKRAVAYVPKFTHLTKLLEKVRKPSVETSSIVSILMLLISAKFQKANLARNNWAKSLKFLTGHSVRVRKYIEKLPDKFK